MTGCMSCVLMPAPMGRTKLHMSATTRTGAYLERREVCLTRAEAVALERQISAEWAPQIMTRLG